MQNGFQRIRVFIASPGDVNEERVALESLINKLNKNHAHPEDIFLELVKWETDTYSNITGQHPQEIIFEQIGSYDVFIGIMWKRFGSPTNHADSGTEDEFRTAYNLFQQHGRPMISFFFKQKDFFPNENDITQFQKVLKFKKELFKLGIVEDYTTLEDFKDRIERCIIQRIKELKKKMIL